MFIALLVPALRDAPSAWAALAAGLAATVLAVLPFKLGLLPATFVGVTVGLLIDSRRPRPRPHRGEEAA